MSNLIEIPEIKKVKIKELKVDGKNPNKMSASQKRALKENILKFGFIVPIVTNKDYLIADGEHRFLIAKELKMESVPVIALPLEEVDRSILRQVLNKLKGKHDKKLDYAEYLSILEKQGNLEELSSLLAVNEKDSLALIEAFNKVKTEEDNFDIDKAYKEAGIEVVKGDIFVLGDNRLMCGDSTNSVDVEKLMDGKLGNIVFTDPPYNVGYSYDGYDEGKKRNWKNMFNDKITNEKYGEFIGNVLNNCYRFSVEKAPVFMWTGWTCVKDILNKLGSNYSLHQVCVWIKNHFVFSKGQIFHRATENCLVLFKDGHFPCFVNKIYCADKDDLFKLDFVDFVDLFNVWYESKDNTKDYVHPTQKPIRLAERALKATTMPGDLVIDLFGGSGSTLIACEQMGRRAFLMELDPKYCDVIIKRWEKFTSKKAVKVS